MERCGNAEPVPKAHLPKPVCLEMGWGVIAQATIQSASAAAEARHRQFSRNVRWEPDSLFPGLDSVLFRLSRSCDMSRDLGRGIRGGCSFRAITSCGYATGNKYSLAEGFLPIGMCIIANDLPESEELLGISNRIAKEVSPISQMQKISPINNLGIKLNEATLPAFFPWGLSYHSG